MIDAFRRDLAHALRSLRRTPAFTTTAVLILGLGIGMASAMFSVFQQVVVRRLPVQDQDRIVALTGIGQGATSKEVPLSPDQYHRFRDQNRTLVGVAGFAHWGSVTDELNDGDRPLVLRVAAVTGNFFQVLGVKSALGRLLQPDDARDWGPDPNTVVISYDVWHRLFRGDSSVIGRRLQGPQMHWNIEIVGVAPPGLDYPRGAEYWVAANYDGMDLVARMAPGVKMEAARDDYFAFVDNDPEYIKAFGRHTITAQVQTLEQVVVGDVRPALLVLAAAVCLLLLLACVNIGNLLLLRASGRARELAIRRALGAGAGAIVRGLVAESMLIALGGGVLGVGFAWFLLEGLLKLAPDGLPRLDVISLAGAPFGIAGIVTSFTVLVFGVAPSLATLRFDIADPLRTDTRSGTEGPRLRIVRRVLVASQIALALVVLSSAGLLVRSFARLAGLNLGYSTEHLSVLTLAMPWQPWVAQCRPTAPLLTAADSARSGVLWQRCTSGMVFAFHDRVMEHFRALPEVVSLSTIAVPPFLGANVWITKIVAEGQSPDDGAKNPSFSLEPGAPDFFRTLDVPILKGRGFTDADREDAMQVAVVTEDVARRLWPHEDVVGKRFHHYPGGAGSVDTTGLVTIVGVIGDLHYREHRKATPTVLRPFRQGGAQGYFVIRTRGSLQAALPGIRRAMKDADPGAVLVKDQTMDELIAPQIAAPRFDAFLLSIFALTAVILAAIGLYGIMASAVAQQTRELGVRMALGATPGRLRQMVLGQALWVAGAGAVVGLLGALAGSRLLTSMLFEVSPTDPITLIGVSVLLLGVGLLAAYLPARRATRIDPARALRAE